MKTFISILASIFLFSSFMKTAYAQEPFQTEQHRITFGDWTPPITSVLLDHSGETWTFNPEKHDEANLFNGLSAWKPIGIVLQTEDGIQLGGETDSTDYLGNSIEHTITSSFPYLEIEYELFTQETEEGFDDPAFTVEINGQSLAKVSADTATFPQENYRSSGIQRLFIDWRRFKQQPTQIKLSAGNHGDGENPSWVIIRRLNFWTIPLATDDSLKASVADLRPGKTEQRLNAQSNSDFSEVINPWNSTSILDDFFWHSIDLDFNEEVENKISLFSLKNPPNVTQIETEQFESELFVNVFYDSPLLNDSPPIFFGKNFDQALEIFPESTLKDPNNPLKISYIFDVTNFPKNITSIETYVTNATGQKGESMETHL